MAFGHYSCPPWPSNTHHRTSPNSYLGNTLMQLSKYWPSSCDVRGVILDTGDEAAK